MNVVNTLLAVARRAKDCGMAADIDAPPKIANAFIGLEEKFGKKFDHTSKVHRVTSSFFLIIVLEVFALSLRMQNEYQKI